MSRSERIENDRHDVSSADHDETLQNIRVLLVDNYDSFTYNLVQYLGEISRGSIAVYRNDKITVEGIRREDPTHLIISPGPCTPNEAGISVEVVRDLAGVIPLLGVCLGHQSIGQAFGAVVTRGEAPVHGKTSAVFHDGRTIFAGIPNPFTATRYHSLVVQPELPDCLERSAWTEDGVIMGLRHVRYVVEGVQFHPESILTEPGKDILRNFLRQRGAEWAPHAAGRAVCNG
jgi:anthranilate synthase/aminodeoxychorismate synthase-like glutamine amidotransferase